MSEKRVLTRFFPAYLEAQRFLRIVDGIPYSLYRAMWKTIKSQKGTPQNTADWKNPEEWIPKRLDGAEQDLALRIWRESEHIVNPRYTDGIMALAKIHELSVYSNTFALTEKGEKFLRNDNEILSKIDEYEGVSAILATIVAAGRCKRKVLFDGFKPFCVQNTTRQSDSSIKSLLSYRLRNLVQRDLIEKRGKNYQTTIFGLEWLEKHNPSSQVLDAKPEVAPVSITRLANENNSRAREQLAHYLGNMNPLQFEYLIKLLLEEMGYDNVEVTPASNDKGVDVVADIELGISRVREVIQVKRQKNNIGRPILDQLRGSLIWFDAVRGTIITTSGFTKSAQAAAFAPGAAPITLIDGERLLDLLIEHKIGVRWREIRMLQFEPDSLAQFEPEPENGEIAL